MTEYKSNPHQEDSFYRSIGVSLILHSVIVSAFTLKVVFFPSENLIYESAVRVDIVDLPDKIDPNKVVSPEPLAPPVEEKKPEPPPQQVVEPTPPPPPVVVETPKPQPKPTKEKDAINLDKAKSKQEDALSKLKRLSAIEKISKQVAEDRAREAAQKVAETKFNGNVLAAGTALTGLNKLQHEAYQGDIDRHVKQNWALPEWLARRELKAQVRVRIDEKGQIIGKELVKSSGNPTYDEIVLETVDRSSPFPTPPEKFIEIVAIRGIILGFPE